MNAQIFRGIAQSEAEQRLTRYGPNRLPEKPPEAVWRRVVRQFQSPLIYILLFALAVDLVLWTIEGSHGFPFESVAIGVILIFNASLGGLAGEQVGSRAAQTQTTGHPPSLGRA